MSSAGSNLKRQRDESAAAADAVDTQIARPQPLPSHDSLPVSQAAASTDANTPSSAGMLFQDALESIFSFASLQDLASLMVVSRSWQAAVLSMVPLTFSLHDAPSIDCAARMLIFDLRRHIAHVGTADDRVSFDPPMMQTVASDLPHLHSLHVKFELQSAEEPQSVLTFPPHLRLLSIECVGLLHHVTPFLHSALVALPQQVPSLQELGIHCSRGGPMILAPLKALAQLRKLDLSELLLWPDMQLQSLREMARLEWLCLPDSSLLPHLLAPGHQLRLQEMRVAQNYWEVQEDCDALVTLPTLTRLDARGTACTNADFLLSLPQLRSLQFGSVFDEEEFDAMEWSRITAALRSCHLLTELRLYRSRFTAEQLASILAAMPQLQILSLRWTTGFASLSFLRSGTLPSTLTFLTLGHCTPPLPLSELSHLHPLLALQQLYIESAFESELDGEQFAHYHAPSVLLPSLREFSTDSRP